MLSSDDIVTAINSAGVPDAATLQNIFEIVLAFAPVIQASATAANITLIAAATAFATQSSLQVEINALQAQIANAAAARDTATGVANTAISTLQAQLDAANTQLQKAVAGT